MKKQLLTLLVMLVAGISGAWAETFTGTVSFEAKSRITNNNDGTFTTASNTGNGYALAIADLSGLENIASASSVTVTFTATVPKLRLLLAVGDKNVRGTTANGSNKSTYNTDGLIMRVGTTDGTYCRLNGGTNNSDAFDTSLKISVTLDRVNKKYSYTIVDAATGETTYFSGSDVSTEVSNATIVELYSWSSSATFTISDVSYSYEYTAASYDYTVKAVDANGKEIKTLTSGTSTEAVNYYLPYAFQEGGKWYAKSETSSYLAAVTSINPNATAVYVEDPTIVYFAEGETEAGTTATYSNGNTGYIGGQNHLTAGKTVGELAAGNYKMTVSITGNPTRGFYLRNTSDDTSTNQYGGTNTTGVQDIDITVAETKNFVLNGKYTSGTKTNQSADFDYVVIRTAAKYTVTYVANGGSEVTDETEYTAGSTVTVKADSFKSEANFAGWNTKADGTGTTYWVNGTFAITENTTLYAQWNNHTIYSEGTVGPTDKSNTIWWTAFSPYTTINKGETYKFTFTNNGGSDNWNNYVLIASNKEGHGTMDAEGYAEYFALRADNYGWGANYDATKLVCNYSDDWATWKADMATGNFVTTMNVKFTGTQFVMTSNTTDGETNYVYNFTSTEATEAEAAVLYFCVQSAYLTDYKAELVQDMPESIDVTAGTNGYTPYNCAYNFTVTDNVKAYKAGAPADDVVTMEEVTGIIPAYTGVILRTYKNEETITVTPTKEEATADMNGNKLVAVNAGDDWLDNANYVLMSKGTETMFYQVNSSSEVSIDLLVGKCYLSVDDGISAKASLSINWGGKATAINAVNANANAKAEGKFVKNGAIVIVKNGKTFNAVGAQVK